MRGIAVIGAGTMGTGIAQLAARHGTVVHLIDVDAGVVARSVANIERRFERMVKKGRLTDAQCADAMGRLRPADAIADLTDVDLAVEAVIENLDVKQDIFRALERAVPPGATLATNTSSLSISRIAEGVSTPQRVVGMHFFNPAPVMPLVEVIAGRRSGPDHVAAAVAAATTWGKVPVRAKDTPGFIVNRVARGFYLEALRLLGEGVAGVDEIDAVMRTHGRFRMGPFELMDLVGLDVNYAVSRSVWEQMNRAARFEPHDIQRRLVEAGDWGRKARRGFYAYDGDARTPAFAIDRRSFELPPALADALFAFAARSGAVHASTAEQLVFGRIVAAVINEAGHAYDDDVATAGDIDTAMEQGTNYPRGPLAWADDIGHSTVAALLNALNDTIGDGRYAPAALFA
ncbi:MAG: 3-hydroxyacyl-CoA dehydrogenase NAD-binding domain-containing protein [Phycisphaerae bacterium]